MKYLFINSVAGKGSTGSIAVNLCDRYESEGNECVLAYGRMKNVSPQNIKTYKIGNALDVAVHGVISRVFDFHGYGSKRATLNLIKWCKEYDPDVIWLHNIHGYYINIKILFDYLRSCGKEIRWTLHDCWAFTGHCAYFSMAGCNEWMTHCTNNCVQKKKYPSTMFISHAYSNFELKRRIFVGIPNMTLITPSEWLADLVSKSFLKEYPVEVVHNTIDKSIFKPREKTIFREKYGINSRMILGVADIWNERKGLYDFIKLANMDLGNCLIVLIGKLKRADKKLIQQYKNIKVISYLGEKEKLAEAYSAADVFLNLSYEENYPTVILETRACGTPVIAYNVGGVKETVDETSLVDKGNIVQVYNKLKQIVY